MNTWENGSSERPQHRGRLWIVAAVVGIVSAFAVLLFHGAVSAAEWLSHGWYADSWPEVPALAILFIPIVGGLIVGVLLHLARLPPDPGHGTAEVIEAVALGLEDYPERKTPLKAGAAVISLGSGAPLGPEDPVVEIGGSAAHFLGRKAGLSEQGVQSVVAAGAAAALAAAFHAPLGALVFAAEVFGLRVISRTTALTALTIAVAYATIRLLGVSPALSIPAHGFTTAWELPLCLLLGALLGALAAGQIRLMYSIEFAMLRLRAVPRWVKPVLGGAAIGLAGLFLPQVVGIGYDTLESLLEGALPVWWLLLALGFVKAALVAVSFGTGFLGGFFAPSFLVGASFGALFGVAALAALPLHELQPATFALVGMFAFLAGVVRAPFAAVLITLERTGSLEVLPIVGIAVFAAYRTSHLLEHHSLYTYGIEHPEAKGYRDRKQRIRPLDDATHDVSRLE
jgi:chloride channel protein, CIC family